MKKTTLLNNIKFIIFGLLLVGGLTLVYADGWVAPTASAPAGNIAVPIHTGPSQVKDGGLSVGAFSVYQNAQFAQQTLFDGMLRGGSPLNTSPDSTVSIGGTDTAGIAHTVPVTVAGDVSTNGNIINTAVANTAGGNLCANANGVITLCNISTPAQTQITISAGQNGSATSPGVVLKISQPILSSLTATITVYADHAIPGCNVATTPTTLGTLTIPAFSYSSVSLLPDPTGDCPVPNMIYNITSYSPTSSTTGQAIVPVTM